MLEDDCRGERTARCLSCGSVVSVERVRCEPCATLWRRWARGLAREDAAPPGVVKALLDAAVRS